MATHSPDPIRIHQLAMTLDNAAATIQSIAAALRDIAASNGLHPNPEADPDDPLAFITAPAERESLRITIEHPSWTAAEVAGEVCHRLPGYTTTDKCVRYYWKIARRDPHKRALLPPERLT
jgi:hypothetical protein